MNERPAHHERRQMQATHTPVCWYRTLFVRGNGARRTRVMGVSPLEFAVRQVRVLPAPMVAVECFGAARRARPKGREYRTDA